MMYNSSYVIYVFIKGQEHTSLSIQGMNKISEEKIYLLEQISLIKCDMEKAQQRIKDREETFKLLKAFQITLNHCCTFRKKSLLGLNKMFELRYNSASFIVRTLQLPQVVLSKPLLNQDSMITDMEHHINEMSKTLDQNVNNPTSIAQLDTNHLKWINQYIKDTGNSRTTIELNEMTSSGLIAYIKFTFNSTMKNTTITYPNIDTDDTETSKVNIETDRRFLQIRRMSQIQASAPSISNFDDLSVDEDGFQRHLIRRFSTTLLDSTQSCSAEIQKMVENTPKPPLRIASVARRAVPKRINTAKETNINSVSSPQQDLLIHRTHQMLINLSSFSRRGSLIDVAPPLAEELTVQNSRKKNVSTNLNLSDSYVHKSFPAPSAPNYDILTVEPIEDEDEQEEETQDLIENCEASKNLSKPQDINDNYIKAASPIIQTNLCNNKNNSLISKNHGVSKNYVEKHLNNLSSDSYESTSFSHDVFRALHNTSPSLPKTPIKLLSFDSKLLSNNLANTTESFINPKSNIFVGELPPSTILLHKSAIISPRSLCNESTKPKKTLQGFLDATPKVFV